VKVLAYTQESAVPAKGESVFEGSARTETNLVKSALHGEGIDASVTHSGCWLVIALPVTAIARVDEIQALTLKVTGRQNNIHIIDADGRVLNEKLHLDYTRQRIQAIDSAQGGCKTLCAGKGGGAASSPEYPTRALDDAGLLYARDRRRGKVPGGSEGERCPACRKAVKAEALRCGNCGVFVCCG
jgi:hypothetical protein